MATKLKKSEWDRAAAFWDAEAGEKGIWHQEHDIDPVMLKVLGSVRNKRILEIGCGNGYFSRMLARRGAKVTGMDLSSKLIDFALMREKEKPLGIRYLVRDAAHLRDLKTKSFDIAIGNMCLMDIADAKAAIREASRVLKAGGRFVFSIIHPIFHPHSKHRHIFKKDGKKYFGYTVYRYLSPAAEKFVIWASGVKATAYHRPIEVYIRYLRAAGLLVETFEEIATNKKVKRAKKGEKGVKWRRSRYRTSAEKKMKEMALRELPQFLVVGATKVG